VSIHQVWRDLEWLIHSPDLLSADAGVPLAKWPDAVLKAIEQWLIQERDAPCVIHHAFSSPYRRLGLYAEALLGEALKHAPVQLLAQHAAVHLVNPHKGSQSARQTVGELDYVWRDELSQQIWHWELAVKLYLYLPATVTFSGGLDQFAGLQRRDTLARKTTRLRDHQLVLSSLPTVSAMLGAPVNEAAAYLKGWLFYPLSGPYWDDYALPDCATRRMLNPQHLKGWWLTETAFRERLNQSQPRHGAAAWRWRVVPRLQWLAPQQAIAADTLDNSALLALLLAWRTARAAQTDPRPGLLIAAMAPSDTEARHHERRGNSSAMADQWGPLTSGAEPIYNEIHRGFVVADDWPEGSMKAPDPEN